MPSLRDLVSTGVPLGLDYLNRRRATGNATTTLVNGTNTAAGTLNTAAGNANDIYRRTYDDQLRMLDPYRRAGEDSLRRLTEGTARGGELDKTFDQQFAFDPSKIADTPGYQFRLNEGIKALERAGSAKGTVGYGVDGAYDKALLRYGQGYASNELQNEFNREKSVYDTTFDVFRTNQNDRFARLRDLTGIGLDATGQEARAGSDFAGRTADNMRLNAQQIADLQTQAANARAAGNVAGANALSDVISRGVATVQDLDLLKKLGIGGANLVSKLPLDSIRSGAVPQIPLSSIGGFPLPAGNDLLKKVTGLAGVGGTAATGVAATGTGAAVGAGTAATAGTAGGSAGVTGAITGFLTNPITIGVGAALAAGIIWKKSQVHPTADNFVKGFQDPFVNKQGTGVLNRLVDGFNQSAASGALTREQALQVRAEIQDLTNHFEQQRQAFAAKGSKERTVAEQAQQTMNQYYGPNFSGLFGKIDQAIAQLGGHA